MEKDFLLYIKLSIISFLVKKDFTFLTKKKEIIFDLMTNNKRICVQNGISISESGELFIQTWFPVLKEFLEIDKLIIFTNYINEILEINSYIKEEKDESYNLFLIKRTFHPTPGVNININEDFWEDILKYQINYISLITDFLYIDFPKSSFYKNKNFNSSKFKKYLYNCLEVYVKAFKTINEINKKQDINKTFSVLSIEEINKEIDSELDKYIKGEKDEKRLKFLAEKLKELKNNK